MRDGKGCFRNGQSRQHGRLARFSVVWAKPAGARAARRKALIPRVAGGARERDGVADVGEAGDVGEGALEAEAEAGMRHRAVTAQVAVPGVVFAVDAALGHAPVPYVEPFLTL